MRVLIKHITGCLTICIFLSDGRFDCRVRIVELHIFNIDFLVARASAHHFVNVVLVNQCSARMTQQSAGTRYH